MLDSGNFNRKITLQSATLSKNENGAVSTEWKDVCSPWAKVQTLKGREYYLASAVNAENDINFTIRYRKGINAEMRVIYNDRIFLIKSPPIDVDERHEELLLICKEVINVG